MTTFHTVAFDPYSCGTASSVARAGTNADSSAGGSVSSGVTSLSFSTPGGTSVAVSNLSSPIVFSLTLNTSSLGANLSAVCTFWDTAAGQYSTAGCAGLPNPLPEGVTAAFDPTFVVTSDASIAMARARQRARARAAGPELPCRSSGRLPAHVRASTRPARRRGTSSGL